MIANGREFRLAVYLAKADDWVYADDLARALRITKGTLQVYVAELRHQYGKEAIETGRFYRGVAKYRLGEKVRQHAGL